MTEKRSVAWLGDRILFGLSGIWFVALTFVGFSRSFFLRVSPEPLPPHQTVHGVVFSAWLLLYLVQTLLIAGHRARWHATLGMASVFLLILMIPVGFHVVLVKAASGLKSADEAGFNLTALTLGFAFAFAGLAYRRRAFVHKRLMLFATLMLTVAAADRVVFVLGFEDGRLLRKLLALAPGIALVVYDLSMRRRGALLGVSSLALVTLVVWFIISDVVFLHPSGEAIIRALAKVFVW